ncbi:hypothetical protein [Cryptosporangium sp. NPDC048952]|uniref:hypothetical protein n=1 Tax=Cryptosporangium sp. NPDC048952 TaxID=3363961 RepID=UPI0037230F7D
MNEVDQAVRWMLTEKADTVAEPTTLLAGVHTKIRRRRTRRRALVSALAVVAILAAGTVAWSADRGDRLVPAERPTEGPGSVPPSPVSVGRMPDGFPVPLLALDTPDSWVYTADTRTAPNPWIMIRVSRKRLVPSEGLGTYSSVRVDDRRADLYVVPPRPQRMLSGNFKGGPYLELTYQRASGSWIQISTSHSADTVPLTITADDVVALARGITDQQDPLTDMLRFATSPPGLTMGGAYTTPQGSNYKFVDPEKPDDPMFPDHGTRVPFGLVSVKVRATAEHDDPVRVSTLEAGRWTATKYRSLGYREGPTYVVKIDDHRWITVETDEKTAYDDDEMARFISGISLGTEFDCCG